MPGCVLRASGDEFVPEEFLKGSSFKPCNVFLKGEARGRSSVWTSSGFTVEVSARQELGKQIEDAIEFLNRNRDELSRLGAMQGLTGVELDFGISRKSVFVQTSYLTPELLKAAGSLRIGIEISIYGEDN